MRGFVRIGLSFVGVLAVVGLACKDSGAPVVTASTLQRVAGDTQVNLTGEQLRVPLRVRVTGTDGQPFPGATVTWNVSSGSATAGSPTVVSDTQGFATTTLTLGATPGEVVVQAVVPSLTPVVFHACAAGHPLLALNDTASGALATTDCRFSGYNTGFFTDFYELTVAAPSQGVVITQTGAFDTYLELYLRTGAFLAFDDDIDGSNSNSQLSAILAPGDYLLAPSSFDPLTTGAYTMTAMSGPAALADCEIVWATRGVDVSDSVTTNDCVDSTNGRYYADAIALRLEAGTTLKVNHRSTDFDAALFLHNAAGLAVASNNDSANAGTTTNAFISFPVVTTGSYLLFVGTNDSVTTGGYDLSIASTTTLAGSPRVQGPDVLRLGGLRWPKGRVARTWSRKGT